VKQEKLKLFKKRLLKQRE